MNKKIKIAQVIYGLKSGGAENLLVPIATRLDRERFQVMVIALTRGGPVEEILRGNGVDVRVLRRKGRFNVFDFFRFLKIIRDEKVDILHTHLTMADIVGGIGAKMLGSARHISTCHGRFYPKSYFNKLKQKFGLRLADKIICVSQSLIEEVSKQYGIKKDKLLLVYNGIDIERFKTEVDPGLKRAELKIPPTAFVIGSLGRIELLKGYQFILYAAAEINKFFKDFIVLIVGEGEFKAQLIRLAKFLNIQDKVIFLGLRSDIPQLLQIMDLVVFPSLEEGFPLAVLEAAAAARPIVATNVGGISEIIENQVSGILIPPKDAGALKNAVSFALNAPDKMREMGLKARDYVQERFDQEIMLRNLERIYEEAMVLKERKQK